MQIPSFFYGFYKDVKFRCRKIVTGLKCGQTWNEVINAKDTIDTENNSGLIVLHGPSPLLGSNSHFHCYLPLSYIFNVSSERNLPPEIKEEIFASSLQTSWGMLGLISQINVMWIYPQEKHQTFLKACLEFWDLLDQEGARYSNGSNHGQSLWTLHSNIKYVLANSGVSTERLNAPLPAGELKTLIQLV